MLIAFMALGRMGAGIAANVLKSGMAMTAWNRTPVPIVRSRTAAPYDRKSSVTNRSGTKAYFLRRSRIGFSAACLFRFDWTSTSWTSPSASTARQRCGASEA